MDIEKRIENLEEQCSNIPQLCEDVKEIKTALLGDNFGNLGYGKRLEHVEQKIRTSDKRHLGIGGASGFGGGSIVTAIWEAIKSIGT
jgi:hypothetical protein